jgi:hypothetical protein
MTISARESPAGQRIFVIQREDYVYPARDAIAYRHQQRIGTDNGQEDQIIGVHDRDRVRKRLLVCH